MIGLETEIHSSTKNHRLRDTGFMVYYIIYFSFLSQLTPLCSTSDNWPLHFSNDQSINLIRLN